MIDGGSMPYSAIILSIAKVVGVPGALLLAICTQESNLQNIVAPYDHGSPSYGLCQIKQDTAKSLGYTGNGDGLMIPDVNARYAAKYLKMQLDRYDGDWCKSVAAYNSGTYNPSTIVPGKPKNLKYVKAVKLLLDEEHRDFLICGPRKVE
jgi:soluble lytic murein transglycosylase-like protein